MHCGRVFIYVYDYLEWACVNQIVRPRWEGKALTKHGPRFMAELASCDLSYSVEALEAWDNNDIGKINAAYCICCTMELT